MKQKRAHQQCAAAGNCANCTLNLLAITLYMLLCQASLVMCPRQHLNRAVCLIAVVQMQAHG